MTRTKQELQERMLTLFESASFEFFDWQGHGIGFIVPGKAKEVMNQLLARTDPAHWSGEARDWFYECDEEDWSLYLRSIPHAVFCMASIQSAHRRHMEQYRVTPEQQVALDTELERLRKSDAEWEQNNFTTEALAPLGGPFYTDGGRVWFRFAGMARFHALEGFDLCSFRHLVDGFAADTLGLRYAVNGAIGPSSSDRGILAGGDPSTLEAMGGNWYRDAHQAYYFECETWCFAPVIVKADVATLEHVGGAYARDSQSLFCAGVRKRGIADPASVVSLGYRYARTGSQILYDGKIVSKPGRVDVETARAVSHELLIDAAGHMLRGKNYRRPLPGLDAGSLRFLTACFAVDEHRVYLQTNTNLEVCELADRATVEAASRHCIRDRHGLIEAHFPEGARRVAES